MADKESRKNPEDEPVVPETWIESCYYYQQKDIDELSDTANAWLVSSRLVSSPLVSLLFATDARIALN